MSGADLILAVTEPSLSGLSDLERMLQTASKFQIPVVVCVNKATANPEMTERIDAFCQQNEIPMVGHIPYDPQVVRLTNAGLSIVDEEGPSGSAAREIFPRVMAFLKSKENG
jgi:MinD superfamily P-loop ATPase